MFQVSKTQVLKEGLQYDPAEVPDNMKEAVEKALKWEGGGFDLRTHVVEPKSGQLLKYQPYRRVVNAEGTYYVRKDDQGRERRFSEQGFALDTAQPEVRSNINGDKKLTAK